MSDRDNLGGNSVDKVVALIRAGASIVPAGGFFTELVTSIIPNQRIERIETFIKRLDDRVELLEGRETKRFEENKIDPEYIALFEDGALYAVRSTSEERIEYISSAVVNGMTSENLAAIEARHILGLLNEINDIELIWLCSYAKIRNLRHDPFNQKYYDVLRSISKSLNQTEDVVEKAALQQSYKDHLLRLQLIKQSGKSFVATKLGHMVLKLADFLPDNSWPKR